MGKWPAVMDPNKGNTGSIQREDTGPYARKGYSSRDNGT